MAEKTYEITRAPVPPATWEDYSGQAMHELTALLDSGECEEKAYQQLLEVYPALIPGTHPAIDAGQNGFFPGVISQPKLTGLQSRIPDFAVISWDSGTLYVAFIELESPCKRWATDGGLPTATLTQAIQQLRDWQIWFDEPANVQRFRDEYQIPDHIWRDRDLKPLHILVYGRRTELEATRFQKRRQKLQRPGEILMTWDRLAPNPGLMNPLVVRLTPRGYVALTVPPTVTLGPFSAETHSIIAGKEEAVLRSELIPEPRRRFMAERWPYWDNWIRKRSRDGFPVVTARNLLDQE